MSTSARNQPLAWKNSAPNTSTWTYPPTAALGDSNVSIIAAVLALTRIETFLRSVGMYFSNSNASAFGRLQKSPVMLDNFLTHQLTS
jgi:hypothetical protein